MMFSSLKQKISVICHDSLLIYDGIDDMLIEV